MMNYIHSMGELSRLQEYNCGIYEGSRTVERPYLGASLLAIGIPTIFFYIICLGVMLQKKLRQTTCYKIMIYLGVIDVGAILINCLMTGVLYNQGAFFCTYPDLIYLSGSLALSFWCCSCITCFVLVINRLYNLWTASAANQFKKADPTWRAVVCLTVPTAYLLYFLLFTTPPLFNSDKSAWFFDPFIPNRQTRLSFNNYSHTVNNLLIVFVTTFSYIGFVVLLRSKYRKHGQKFSLFKANPIIIQAVMMCFFNLIAAMVYVYMNYFPMWPPLIVIGHYCWVFGHACPPYLYFYLNPTIHRRLKRVFGCGTRVVPRTILPPRDRSPSMRAQTVEELNLPHLMKFEKALESEA